MGTCLWRTDPVEKQSRMQVPYRKLASEEDERRESEG